MLPPVRDVVHQFRFRVHAKPELIDNSGIVKEEIYQYLLNIFRERQWTEADRDDVYLYFLEVIEKNNSLLANEIVVRLMYMYDNVEVCLLCKL